MTNRLRKLLLPALLVATLAHTPSPPPPRHPTCKALS